MAVINYQERGSEKIRPLIFVFFFDRERMIEVIERALRNGLDYFYIVVFDFPISFEIKQRLNLADDLPLLIPTSHLFHRRDSHSILPEQIYAILGKALNNPEAIFYDIAAMNYRFYVRMNEKVYRIVFQFSVTADYDVGQQGNVLVTLFQDHKSPKKTVLDAKNKPDGRLVFVYWNEEGWA